MSCKKYMARNPKLTRFELRSCVTKRRYKTQPTLGNKLMYSYYCKFCAGWHKATKKD